MIRKLKFKSLLCTVIAFSATLIAQPNTILWLYEPEVPAKLQKR